MLVEAIAIGLVLGFFFFEWTGLVAGGLVVPGYLALGLDRPGMIALCLGVALATMFLIRIGARFMLLYGRRRFILCILTGFALQWTLGAAVIGTEFAQGQIEAVGYIIPGIIANEMDRQGAGPTLISLLLLSLSVRLLMELFDLIPPL